MGRFNKELFREDVIKKRKELKVSMDKVVDKIGVAKPTYSRIENGYTDKVSMTTFEKVLDWLGEPVTKYFEK